MVGPARTVMEPGHERPEPPREIRSLETWLTVLVRMLRVPDDERQEIHDELQYEQVERNP